MACLKLLLCFLAHVSIAAAAAIMIRDEILVIARSSQPVCYDDFGCFMPRPGSKTFPESPEKVNTKFFLHTRNNPTEGTLISALDLNSFDPTKPLKVVIHGFNDRASNTWIVNMVAELLKAEDMNVIAVDWSGGNQFPYNQAAANTVIAAAATRRLLQAIINKGTQSQQMHLIGHSLGAHVSSYIGRQFPNLGRISGLDPAGPDFYLSGILDRLDSSHALFVDVLHTNGAPNVVAGFGYFNPIGHVDFYPNGGSAQPTCASTTGAILIDSFWTLASTWNIEDASATLACNHMSAILYYTDSINPPSPAFGYPCSNYSSFVQGLCTSCSPNGNECQQVGYHATYNRTLGTLYMMTLSGFKPPHFGFQFMVTLVSATNSGKYARGIFEINFNEQDEDTLLFNQNTLMKQDESKSKTILITNNPTPLKEISISFKKTHLTNFGIGFADEWSFRSITVLDMQSNTEYTFCAKSNSFPMIHSGSRLTYQLCA